MLITLKFSQRNVSYYFYENGVAYSYADMKPNTPGNLSGASVFYYDDGNGYINGYTPSTSSSSTSSVITT
jgi:hypothetical protein